MSAVETIKKMYAAYAEGNIEKTLSYCADDVSFSWVAEPSMPYSGGRAGKAEFLGRLNDLHKDYDYHSFKPVDIFGDGDRVVAQTVIEMTRRDNGKRFTLRCADLWTLRDGLVTEMVEYYDTALVAEMDKPAA